jgi:hypothetical protein
LLGTTLLILWLLSRMTLLAGRIELRAAGHFHRIRAQRVPGKGIFREQVTWQRWLGTCHRDRHDFRGPHRGQHHGQETMKWMMVAIIVGSTVLADLLQSFEMKRQRGSPGGPASRTNGRNAGRLAQRGPLVLAVFFMAISFFAFMKLLSVADLSFAVPVTPPA